MTYWLLNAGFLAVAAALAIVAMVTRTVTPRWSRLAIAAVIVLDPDRRASTTC